MRSLYLNIKAKDNPELRASIVSGEMDGSAMWSMSAADMASAEKKAELAAMSREALFNAQAAAPKKSETDMFECGKCKKRRTTYYQMQTRSADEVGGLPADWICPVLTMSPRPIAYDDLCLVSKLRQQLESMWLSSSPKKHNLIRPMQFS